MIAMVTISKDFVPFDKLCDSSTPNDSDTEVTPL